MPIHLTKNIENLKAKIIQMSKDIEHRVSRATLSVIERDKDTAQEVIARDYEIDQLEVEIEEDCLRMLALYQPVAVDLRFIVTAMKINNELERIGDLAVNIAERSMFLADQKEFETPFDIASMTTQAQSMLTRSIYSLVNMDVRLARRVRSEDDKMDEKTRDMYSRVKDAIPNNPEGINFMLHALSVGKHLERIADHATNIAEDVIYLVDAEIVRHTPETYED